VVRAADGLRVKLVAPTSQAAALFHGRLFEIAPAVKPLLRGDMTEQGCKLMATLGVVVKSLGNLEAVLPAASALAKRHVDHGVKAADYPPVGAALLWTLEQGFSITMSEPLVIVGNGMAAACLCEELAQRALGRYAIAVIGEEPRLAYNRVLLSSVLAGEVRASDISLKPAAWWSDRGITLCYGVGVTAADIAARTVTLSDDKALPFAKLVFATGSRPICLRIAGADLPGVLTFRDMSHVASMSRAACRSAPIVVIGGGLLGIEAAYGLAKAGASVTLVHLVDRLMERQLDARAALLLKRAVEAKGIRVLLDVATRDSSAMVTSRV